MPDVDQIRSTLPSQFNSFPKLVLIINCSEIFIETPRDLEVRHSLNISNNFKFLISITPSSFIKFVSEPYTGRISDKAVTKETPEVEQTVHANLEPSPSKKGKTFVGTTLPVHC